MQHRVMQAAAVAATFFATSVAGAAPPLPWQEVTYSSVEQGGVVRLRQFDPAKGSLISARAETFGFATFLLTTKAPLTAPTPYAFKVGYYIYYGLGSFHLYLDGGSTLAPYQPTYEFLAKGKGVETVSGAGLNILKGTGTLTLSFSTDLPQPPPPGVPPGTFESTKRNGSVSITYRYYPSLKIQPKTLPKQVPVPKPFDPHIGESGRH